MVGQSVVGQSGQDGLIYAHACATALSQVLALRVHLDDSRADNGPLRVLPATHNLGVLDDDTMPMLAAQIAPVDCLVARGGVLAMRPLLVHASSKSQAVPRGESSTLNTLPPPFCPKSLYLRSREARRRSGL